MAHSFSSLKMLEQCPQQYKVVRIDKLYPYKETPATAFGNRAHAALEKFVQLGTAMPLEFSNYKWVTDQLIPLTLPHRIAECEFSFLRGGAPTGHRDWANKYWSGKADLMAFDHPLSKDWPAAGGVEPPPVTRAQVVDWKTGGSKYPDVEQLELMALFSFYAHPSLQVVEGFLVFLQDAKIERATFTRHQMSYLEAKWNQKAMVEEQRRTSNDWPMVKSHLCPWCPHTKCENWTPPKAKS